MTENKLQKIARTLGGWILASKGAEKGTLAEVLVMVTDVMGKGQEKPTDNDPVFWFDPMGRFCTRAQTKEEIQDSMMLMAIAEGISIDDICQDDPQWEDRMIKWDAYQEMKLKYMEERMRVKELEAELKAERELKLQNSHSRRIGDIEHFKQLILMAMDLAGTTCITKEALEHCFDVAPTVDARIAARWEEGNAQ